MKFRQFLVLILIAFEEAMQFIAKTNNFNDNKINGKL